MLPLKVLAVQIGCAYAMWIFGKFACKVNIQEVAFALPITFIMPATVSGIAGKPSIPLNQHYNSTLYIFRDVLQKNGRSLHIQCSTSRPYLFSVS